VTIARGEHVGKSLAERQDYVRTTIAKQPAPTVDEQTIYDDSTATSRVDEAKPPSRRAVRSTTKKVRTTAFTKLWRERGPEIVFSVILIPVLLWIVTLLFGFNRELGETKQKVDSVKESQQHYDQELDRNHREIERLRDLLEPKTNSSQTKPTEPARRR